MWTQKLKALNHKFKIKTINLKTRLSRKLSHLRWSIDKLILLFKIIFSWSQFGHCCQKMLEPFDTALQSLLHQGNLQTVKPASLMSLCFPWQVLWTKPHVSSLHPYQYHPTLKMSAPQLERPHILISSIVPDSSLAISSICQDAYPVEHTKECSSKLLEMIFDSTKYLSHLYMYTLAQKLDTVLRNLSWK